LLNPLIDEYSLKGAKGLLVNITGGTDLTLFEVDEAVNKIRAEVDPEAELIFGSIEDQNLNGKIRVSIVATSLDGQEPQIKPVISMVHRINNRNTGYSDAFTSSHAGNQATIKATEGATALDLNNIVEENKIILPTSEKAQVSKEATTEPAFENISIDNATYLQNLESASDNIEHQQDNDTPTFEIDSIELANSELFPTDADGNSLDQVNQDTQEPRIFENINSEKEGETKEPEMFEESNSEEELEIPAFLRRQKN